jgi:hypothetical protein
MRSPAAVFCGKESDKVLAEAEAAVAATCADEIGTTVPIVYIPVDTALFWKFAADAIAFTVAEEVSMNEAPEATAVPFDPGTGVVPFVVYVIVAPAVESVRVIRIGDEEDCDGGLIAGVAAVGVELIVYVTEATALFWKFVAVAIALTVAEDVSVKGVV